MTRSFVHALSLAPALALGVVATFSAPASAQDLMGEVATEFDDLHFRSIGPATMSGRISDLAVYDANPAVYYVATAHGGLWKTESGGVTFEALFQDEGLISIGDVAISQSNPDLVWVGAGESNNRQTTSWGGGLYKSEDGGETFEFIGLPESRHINRIVIHPDDDDVVLVAATGPLFGPGGDRGVYKTTDGGRSWDRVLHVDEDTGANDLVVSAQNPNVMFASTYQRRRTTCCMNGGGPGSGLWKSTDAGDTWARVGGGFPEGPLGRIAVDVFSLDGSVVYALVEAPRPEDSDAEWAQGLYRSQDGGETWELRGNVNPRPMYFSQVRIDPVDPDRVYMGGVGLHLSVDGGETFERDAARVTHDDVHGIWINPNNPDHVLIGNDGGLAVSWDRAFTWQFLPNLPVASSTTSTTTWSGPSTSAAGCRTTTTGAGPARRASVAGS
jgi:photosystem II stability/assembly factor-like uncharacterized protein